MPPGSVDLGGEEPVDGDVVAEEVAPKGRGSRGRRGSNVRAMHNRLDKVEEQLGAAAAGVNAQDFMKGQAEEDRATTKARHIDDGLEAVLEMVKRMQKALAYAAVVHKFDVKLAVLEELAETAAAVAEDAQRALKDARKETRNAQPST